MCDYAKVNLTYLLFHFPCFKFVARELGVILGFLAPITLRNNILHLTHETSACLGNGSACSFQPLLSFAHQASFHAASGYELRSGRRDVVRSNDELLGRVAT